MPSGYKKEGGYSGRIYRKGQTGEKAGHWRGGEYKCLGYILVYSPYHPNTTKDGYVRRSHLVMEKKLGRFLNKNENVHHINYIKEDDSPKNLQLFSSNSEHAKFHHPKGYRNKGSWKKGHIPWNKGKKQFS